MIAPRTSAAARPARAAPAVSGCAIKPSALVLRTAATACSVGATVPCARQTEVCAMPAYPLRYLSSARDLILDREPTRRLSNVKTIENAANSWFGTAASGTRPNARHPTVRNRTMTRRRWLDIARTWPLRLRPKPPEAPFSEAAGGRQPGGAVLQASVTPHAAPCRQSSGKAAASGARGVPGDEGSL